MTKMAYNFAIASVFGGVNLKASISMNANLYSYMELNAYHIQQVDSSASLVYL